MSRILVTLAALGALALAAPALADETPRARCFMSSQFENWKALDGRTIYVRVSNHHYYRLDLVSNCQELTWPGSFLVMQLRGSNSICSPLDWDIHVARSWHDIPQACIVKTMTELTPDEAAAIPPKFKP